MNSKLLINSVIEGLLCRAILVLVMAISPVFAQDNLPLKEGTEIIPVRPDGQRDWSANRYRVEGSQAVPIRPDGQRDWSSNTYRTEGGQIVPVRPDGKRDWSTSSGRR